MSLIIYYLPKYFSREIAILPCVLLQKVIAMMVMMVINVVHWDHHRDKQDHLLCRSYWSSISVVDCITGVTRVCLFLYWLQYLNIALFHKFKCSNAHTDYKIQCIHIKITTNYCWKVEIVCSVKKNEIKNKNTFVWAFGIRIWLTKVGIVYW